MVGRADPRGPVRRGYLRGGGEARADGQGAARGEFADGGGEQRVRPRGGLRSRRSLGSHRDAAPEPRRYAVRGLHRRGWRDRTGAGRVRAQCARALAEGASERGVKEGPMSVTETVKGVLGLETRDERVQNYVTLMSAPPIRKSVREQREEA